ncbi:hypothetical protein [Streptomyces xantholiticus]|uniref:Uncharacterized protein n=1 Tax=Streptomyces xantholiticus TaxID=68285 RepID=A0ABV1UVS3_9ACTN
MLHAEDQWDHIAQRYGHAGPHGTRDRLLLSDDVRRLVESPLTGAELNALWRLTDSNALDGSPDISGQERDWLVRVLSVVTPNVKPHDPSEAPPAVIEPCALGTGTPETAPRTRMPTYEHRMLASDVKDLSDRLNLRQEAVGVTLPEARDVLARCAEEVCSEIAFRFLLHGFEAFRFFVSRDLYGRLERVGERFGYGPHVVDRIQYLVE